MSLRTDVLGSQAWEPTLKAPHRDGHLMPRLQRLLAFADVIERGGRDRSAKVMKLLIADGEAAGSQKSTCFYRFISIDFIRMG